MGTNVNLSDLLNKIAADTGFLTSAGDKFGAGEKLNFLFISTGTDKGDSLVLQDTSGDSYHISTEELGLTDEQLQALLGEDAKTQAGGIDNSTEIKLGETEAVNDVDNVEATQATGAATNVAATGSADAIQQEIEGLERQREANAQSMETLKTQIEDLREQIEQRIEEATKKMEAATEEQQERANEIVQEQLKDFQTRRANGEDVSPQDLAAAVSNQIKAEDMPTGFASALSDMMMADSDMALMNNLLDQLSAKVQIDADLGNQIDTKEAEYEAAKAAEEAAKAAESSKSCDPIGFQMADKDGNEFQVDFIYDKDDDGQINSMDDFVGAKADKAGEDGWSEMEAANTDGDETITADEMQNAGMKAVITNAAGEQEVITMEEFEERFGKIEIGAQDTEVGEEGFVEGVGPRNFDADAGNELLSSFNVTVDGQELSGYQTRDTEDWLVDNFSNVMDLDSIAAEGVDVEGAQAAQAQAQTQALAQGEYAEFINEYREVIIPQLEADIEAAYAELGFSETLVDTIKELAVATAELESTKIEAEIEEEEQALIEEQEAQDAENETEVDGEGQELTNPDANTTATAITDENDDATGGTGEQDDLTRLFKLVGEDVQIV